MRDMQVECIEIKEHGRLNKSRIGGIIESLHHKKEKEMEQKRASDFGEHNMF